MVCILRRGLKCVKLVLEAFWCGGPVEKGQFSFVVWLQRSIQFLLENCLLLTQFPQNYTLCCLGFPPLPTQYKGTMACIDNTQFSFLLCLSTHVVVCIAVACLMWSSLPRLAQHLEQILGKFTSTDTTLPWLQPCQVQIGLVQLQV